jgi:hypothetical protein
MAKQKEVPEENLKVTAETKPGSNDSSRLEAMYEKFKTSKSNFAASEEDAKQENLVVDVPEVEPEKEKEPEGDPVDDKETAKVKFKMLLAFLNFVCAGLHVIFFNMLSKYKVSIDDIKLDDKDLETLESYVPIEKVMEILKKIPVWVFPALHVEFIFITNWTTHISIEKKKEIEKSKVIKDMENITSNLDNVINK